MSNDYPENYSQGKNKAHLVSVRDGPSCDGAQPYRRGKANGHNGDENGYDVENGANVRFHGSKQSKGAMSKKCAILISLSILLNVLVLTGGVMVLCWGRRDGNEKKDLEKPTATGKDSAVIQGGSSIAAGARDGSLDKLSAGAAGSVAGSTGPRTKVLSVDAGGILGIMPVIQLYILEAAGGVKAHDLFDSFYGASSGGVIALALAGCLGRKVMSAEQILKLFLEVIFDDLQVVPTGKAFSPMSMVSDFMGSTQPDGADMLKKMEGIVLGGRELSSKPTFDTEVFTKRVEEEILAFAGKNSGGDASTFTLGQCAKHVGIKTVDAKTGEAILLTSEKHATVPVVVALRATTAAPTFFALQEAHLPTDKKGAPKRLLADGGLQGSNPTEAAYFDAVNRAKAHGSNGSNASPTILSLGTGRQWDEIRKNASGISMGLDAAKYLTWSADMKVEENMQALVKAHGGEYLRINPALPSDVWGLVPVYTAREKADMKSEIEARQEQAEAEARKATPAPVARGGGAQQRRGDRAAQAEVARIVAEARSKAEADVVNEYVDRKFADMVKTTLSQKGSEEMANLSLPQVGWISDNLFMYTDANGKFFGSLSLQQNIQKEATEKFGKHTRNIWTSAPFAEIFEKVPKSKKLPKSNARSNGRGRRMDPMLQLAQQFMGGAGGKELFGNLEE